MRTNGGRVRRDLEIFLKGIQGRVERVPESGRGRWEVLRWRVVDEVGETVAQSKSDVQDLTGLVGWMEEMKVDERQYLQGWVEARVV